MFLINFPKLKFHVEHYSRTYLNESNIRNAYYLGINYGGDGQCNHIQFRLQRSSKWDSNFYPYDEVLDTMLHELCLK